MVILINFIQGKKNFKLYFDKDISDPLTSQHMNRQTYID